MTRPDRRHSVKRADMCSLCSQITARWRTFARYVWITPSWGRTVSAPRLTRASSGRPLHKCCISLRYCCKTVCVHICVVTYLQTAGVRSFSTMYISHHSASVCPAHLIQVVYALLMPASGTLGDDACDFQYNFLKSGGLPLVLGMLTRNNFLTNADVETRRGAYLNALKIAKLLLTAIGFGHVKAVAEACQPVVEGTNPASPVPCVMMMLSFLNSWPLFLKLLRIL